MKANILIPAAFGLLLSLTPSVHGQSTTRVSVDSAGIEGLIGSNNRGKELISADGRCTVFISASTNLVPGDTNGLTDVFVHDRTTGITTRVNVDSLGVQANDAPLVTETAISADGHLVAFSSNATNLVTGDTNGFEDVFVHDRRTGATTRVSVDSLGTQANGHSTFLSFLSFSGDGRYLGFSSKASNLVSPDTNGQSDVFLHDLITGQTTMVSLSSLGVQGNFGAEYPSISNDGRYVAFSSYSSNLVSGDINGSTDIFVRDRLLGLTTRISVDTAGSQANSSSQAPSISGDGNYVVFSSNSSNLVPGDINGHSDIFLRNRSLGTTTRVNLGPGGVGANDATYDPVISSDGSHLAYYSGATNLTAGIDLNGFVLDSFLYEISSGTTTLLGVDSLGAQGLEAAVVRTLSKDGRYASFGSGSTSMVPNDTNGSFDIFLRDTQGPSLTKQGLCPGPITLTVSGGTVGQDVAVLYGSAGLFLKPTAPCLGLELGIATPNLAGLLPTNTSAIATLSFTAPAGACGLTVQAVDIVSCMATNTMVL